MPYENEQLKAGSIVTTIATWNIDSKEFLDIEIAKLKLSDVISFIDKHRDRGNSYDYVG